ncbi:MAG: hypothetical protein ACTSYF_03615 [Promethearchaeota archaeon]
MIYCKKCNKFISPKTVKYGIDGFERIFNPTGYCRHCKKRVPIEYDTYFDIVGYPKN